MAESKADLTVRPLNIASITDAFKLKGKAVFDEITSRHWYALGLLLLPEDVCDKTLREIVYDPKDGKPSYERILRAWLEHSGSEEVTWESLLSALKSLDLKGVSADDLGADIEKWLLAGVEQGSRITHYYRAQTCRLTGLYTY